MRSYRQDFCPIARAAELLAERWTFIIVRNLLLGCETFSEIAAGAPGISETLLTQRLRALERFGIVERHQNPCGRGWLYRLSPAGRDLQRVCDSLGTWGARWLDAAPRDVDPGILLWGVAKTMDPAKFPKRRVLVRFELRDAHGARYWILIQRQRAELCRKHPGGDEDLLVRSDIASLMRWHIGRTSTRGALRDGSIEIVGPPALVRAFVTWGGQSPLADVKPKVAPARS